MSVRRFATTLAATAAAIRASGIYFAGALDNLGIVSEVKAKAKTPAGGHVPVLVQSFIRFLTAPEAARVYQAGGMEPG